MSSFPVFLIQVPENSQNSTWFKADEDPAELAHSFRECNVFFWMFQSSLKEIKGPYHILSQRPALDHTSW